MNAMQYKITLPNDYDMDTIRKRVSENGNKTDGFTGLFLKAYLILDTETKKEYSPLYLWNNSDGMNKFIFEGYYDNILNSFGFQQIAIGIPFKVELSKDFKDSIYILELEKTINETNKMTSPTFTRNDDSTLGKVLIYNPDKWKYVELYFYKEKPLLTEDNSLLYEILHISV